MPTGKISAFSTPNMMKSDNEINALDNSSGQTIRREPFISFSRATENQVQLMQLLHGDIPGWPLLSSLKVQMQKCDKCSREFFSSINYRRHLRIQHRLKKPDKDTIKNRELLAAFWDQLSADDYEEVTSITNEKLEEVTGSSLVKALTSLVWKPGFSPLPPVCLKAGCSLLEIVQGRLKFPISSQKLLSILDDASEKTFLYGITVAMQKYVFNGEASKVCLETKNVVACSSFLLEQNLVKAWFAHKDAVALRCQKLLVEEEEAARKRKAAVLERKRQKKLRQKEHKARDQKTVEKTDVKDSTDNTLKAEPPAETPSTSTASDSEIQSEDRQCENNSSASEPTCSPKTDDGASGGAQSGLSNGHTDTANCDGDEHGNLLADDSQGLSQRQVPPKIQRGLPSGFHASHASQGLKLGMVQKQGNQRDLRNASGAGGSKVWSRKPKPQNDNINMETKAQKMVSGEFKDCKNSEVLIGSIPVTLGNKISYQECDDLTNGKDDGIEEHQIRKTSVPMKPLKSEFFQFSVNQPAVKLWRPVSRNGTKDQVEKQSGDKVPEADVLAEKCNDVITSNDMTVAIGEMGSNSVLEEDVCTGGLEVSISAAKAFLAQRWKEAIESDHVKLVLSTESDRNNDSQAPDYSSVVVDGNAENLNFGSQESLANSTWS